MSEIIRLNNEHLDPVWQWVDRPGPDACWLWKGQWDKFGQPTFRLNVEGCTVFMKAHWVLYRLVHGVVLTERDSVCRRDHRCMERKCLNPKHMYLKDRANGTAHGPAKKAVEAVHEHLAMEELLKRKTRKDPHSG
jgi:hypothetical protein